MKDEARKLFLAGVGTAALACEKAGDVINDLIQKGKLSVEEGKELSQELKRDITDKGTEKKENIIKKIDDMKPLTKDVLKDVLEDMNYSTKADMLEIKRRLEKIEEKLGIVSEEVEGVNIINDNLE